MSGRYHSKTNATTATATYHDSKKAATANMKQSNSCTGKKLKIIILGGMNAGKTCLLHRYCFNTFDPERRATIGADYYTKQIVNPLLSSDNGIASNDTIDRLVYIQLWDTAGLEGFKENTDNRRSGSTLGKSFFRNINGALLVYDATSYHSFRALVQWYQILLENSDIPGSDVKAVPVVVVANKIDKLNYELEKPFLKMVPQRNVLGLRANTFRESIPSRRKLDSDATIGKLEQKMLQDVAEPAGNSYGPFVVSSSANHNTEKLDIDKDPMSRLQHIRAIDNPFQDTKYSDLPPLKLGEGKSYSLSLSKDFYGSFLNRASSEQRNKKHFNNSISFESIWKESSSIDDTLPDSDKVLQWCMSNNITIFEASALDGTGVNEAVEFLIKLCLEINYKIDESKSQQRATNACNRTTNWIHSSMSAEVTEVEASKTMACHKLQSKQKDVRAGVTSTVSFLPKNTKFIDLQARYKPQKSKLSICCCGCISISQCWPQSSKT